MRRRCLECSSIRVRDFAGDDFAVLGGQRRDLGGFADDDEDGVFGGEAGVEDAVGVGQRGGLLPGESRPESWGVAFVVFLL